MACITKPIYHFFENGFLVYEKRIKGSLYIRFEAGFRKQKI